MKKYSDVHKEFLCYKSITKAGIPMQKKSKNLNRQLSGYPKNQ